MYVRAPQADAVAHCDGFGWHGPFDLTRATDEHLAFRHELERAGARVLVGETPVPGNPDAIYAFDPVLITDRGVIALRPGKEGRRGEPNAVLGDLTSHGLTELGMLSEPATAEGGDMFWLDEMTLLVGRGYRTNDAGVEQLRSSLPEITVHAFDLPYQDGPRSCLHLLSLLSPLDDDLAVGYLPLLPVRLVQLLQAKGIAIVECTRCGVPDDGTERARPGPSRRARARRQSGDTSAHGGRGRRRPNLSRR